MMLSAKERGAECQADENKVIRCLQNMFTLFDEAGIVFCLSHGYEKYPSELGRDVDIIIQRSINVDDLISFFTDHRSKIGATLVYHSGMYITLATHGSGQVPQFVHLDFSHDATCGLSYIADGDAILRTRERWQNIWIPAQHYASAIVLFRALYKDFNQDHCENIDSLRGLETRSLLNGIFGKRDYDLISHAFSRDRADPILSKNFKQVRRRMMIRAFFKAPRYSLKTFAKSVTAKIGRLLAPPGMHIAVLGPDGAGKSTLIAGLDHALSTLFTRVDTLGFAPSIRFRPKQPRDTSTPHALPPRSYWLSLLRAAFWVVYGLSARVTLHLSRSRNRLILNDRHLIDVLVDPVRYRYGGPSWALKLAIYMTPLPDLVFLLAGPPEVIQARKREISIEETARQCNSYLELVGSLRQGVTVDAVKSPESVLSEVINILLETRARKRSG